MDPGRPSYNAPPLSAPYGNPSSAKARSIPSTNSPQLPSLPSIRQLHPDLPPVNVPPHHMTSSSGHMPAIAYPAPGPSSTIAARPPSDNSDAEEEPAGPPKKKRRRQALSCTECKRRKIKCDRNQPCGPCSRRGEQNKCQWHIIEPMEKYVSRAEYDELKNRLDYLENTLTRLVPGYIPSYGPRSTMASPTMPKAPAGAVDSAQATVMTPYHAHGSPAYPNYRGIASSSSSIQSEPPIPPPGQLPPAPPNRSPVVLSRPPTFMPPMSATPAQRPYHRATSTSPVLSSSSRPSEARAAGSRRASLSLAAITSPFTPDVGPYSKPKNHQAQTLPSLGQRLRRKSPRTGPAAENLHLVPRDIHTPIVRRARPAQKRVLALYPRHRGWSPSMRVAALPTCRLARRQCQQYTLLGISTTGRLVTPLEMLRSNVQEHLRNDCILYL